MQADLPGKVKTLLAMELGMYKTLRTMVSRELEAIVLNCDMEELLGILQEKQEVISRLQLLADAWHDVLPDMGFEEKRGTSAFWDKINSIFSEKEAAAFSDTLNETRAAAEDLMAAESEAQFELEKHVKTLREKIRSMNRGKEAFIGYTKMGGVINEYE